MKNCNRTYDIYHEFKKCIQVMKITILLFFVGVGLLNANSTFGQEKISLNAKNKILRSVLDDIKKKSGYVFLYNDNALDINKVVNVSVKDYRIIFLM